MPSSDLEVVERGEPTEFDPFSLLLPNEREVVIEWLTTDHALPRHRTVNVAVVHPTGLRPTVRPSASVPRLCLVCGATPTWVVLRNNNPGWGQPIAGDVLCTTCYNRRSWRSNKYAFARYRRTCSRYHAGDAHYRTAAVYDGSCICERCARDYYAASLVRLRDV